MNGHPVQLDEPENALKGNTVALDLEGTHSGFPTETGQPIPKIGSFEDLGSLTKSGMGAVRLVQDRNLNRQLAMKFLHPKRLSRRITTSRYSALTGIGKRLEQQREIRAKLVLVVFGQGGACKLKHLRNLWH